jgi:hypothetical protein
MLTRQPPAVGLDSNVKKEDDSLDCPGVIGARAFYLKVGLHADFFHPRHAVAFAETPLRSSP